MGFGFYLVAAKLGPKRPRDSPRRAAEPDPVPPLGRLLDGETLRLEPRTYLHQIGGTQPEAIRKLRRRQKAPVVRGGRRLQAGEESIDTGRRLKIKRDTFQRGCGIERASIELRLRCGMYVALQRGDAGAIHGCGDAVASGENEGCE